MLDARGELLHIVADNALSALIPVPADGTYTQAHRSLESTEKGTTQPSLVSSVTNNIISSEGDRNITSDDGALSTSHSSTTAVPHVHDAGRVEQKIGVDKNTRKRTHASVSSSNKNVSTMSTFDSKVLTPSAATSVDRTHLGRAVNRKTKTTA